MENGWQKVYSTHQQHRVEILRAILEDNNIQSVAVDKRDSSYVMLGDIDVFVKNEDVILAKIIIEENQL